MACFVAIFNTDGAPVDARLLHSMLAVAPFLGPPDPDIWVGDAIGLGSVQLPVAQNNHVSVVFDGRLDDRDALVGVLQQYAGRDLSVASDVELALAAYEAWGAECATHIIGDFAFCVWDAQHRRLLCVRDHFGVKPLYYAWVGRSLIVSNVLRSMRRHPLVSERLDERGIGDFLLFGLCLDLTQTSFADVARVPPAHTLAVGMRDSAPRVSRYWELQAADPIRYRDPREYVERYSTALETAVRDRLRGGPIGVLMSGGLDSSSIAATAVSVCGSPLASTSIRAFTAVYDTDARDHERQYSSLVARTLGLEIEHHAVDAYRFFERWDEDILPPEPSTEPMTAMMADLLDRASRHGAAVLTGDGGDPLHLPSTVASQLHWGALGILAGDIARSVWRLGTLPPFGIRTAIRKRFDRQAGVPIWLAEAFVKGMDLDARCREIAARRSRTAGHRGVALRSILHPIWPSTFETHDPGATGRPVALRYPFFDVRLVSQALSLPSYPWCMSKEILRTAMRRRLPEAVRTRPKSPLAIDIFAIHGRWTMSHATDVIKAVPAMAEYVDIDRFQKLVRPDALMSDDEPGTIAAIALATWLRCAATVRAAA